MGDSITASCSASLIVCADEKTQESVMDRLQPYQWAILNAPKVIRLNNGRIKRVEADLPSCRNCTHCGPDVKPHPISGVMLIRCDHPDWDDEETEMREIDPTFGEMCADHSMLNNA